MVSAFSAAGGRGERIGHPARHGRLGACRRRGPHRRAQLGRARARIGGDLRVRRLDGLAADQREGGAARRRLAGAWREPPAEARERSVRKGLTMRSSSEWKRHHHEPPAGLQHALGGEQRAPRARPSSSFTAMRSAWKVRVAGWMSPGFDAHHAGDDVGELARRGDRRLRARGDDGARHGAGVALLAEREDDVGQRGLVEPRDEVGGALALASPCACRAAPSARNEKPRSASSSCIDDTPMSSTTPSTWAKPRSAATRVELARSGPRPASAGRPRH